MPDSEKDNSKYADKPELFKASWGNRVDYGIMSFDEEKRYLDSSGEFEKTNRTDHGRAVNIKIPQGYHGQVKKSWEMYSTDRLFKYLVDRCIEFGANGFEWEIPIDFSTLNETEGLSDKVEEERRFWDVWASRINKKTSNVIPGMDEINKWIYKQMLLGGMAPLEWEWGKMSIDGKVYEVPTRLTTHNCLSTLLVRKGEVFQSEEVRIKTNANRSETKEVDTQTTINTVSASGSTGPGWHVIPALLGDSVRPILEGFVLKYNWTPGDNTTSVYGSSVTTGQGLYPQPPFYSLNEVLLLRRQLCAADIAILDGIINYIIDWSIGDDTKDSAGNLIHEPHPAKYNASGQKIRKSTIEQVKEMITTDSRANVMQLFHPYYYKLDIKMPDINSLISSDKYIQSIVEMLMSFGIFLSPTDRRVDFTDINIANFEQMLDNIRTRHIKRFWEALCEEIVERNSSKLTYIPNMIFNPLNTQDSQFRESLLSLAKMGKVSMESLNKAHKLDKNSEIHRIRQEIANGEKALADENVPLSFVQETVNPSNGTDEETEEDSIDDNDEKEKKTVGRSATKDGGRPSKEGEEDDSK